MEYEFTLGMFVRVIKPGSFFNNALGHVVDYIETKYTPQRLYIVKLEFDNVSRAFEPRELKEV